MKVMFIDRYEDNRTMECWQSAGCASMPERYELVQLEKFTSIEREVERMKTFQPDVILIDCHLNSGNNQYVGGQYVVRALRTAGYSGIFIGWCSGGMDHFYSFDGVSKYGAIEDIHIGIASGIGYGSPKYLKKYLGSLPQSGRFSSRLEYMRWLLTDREPDPYLAEYGLPVLFNSLNDEDKHSFAEFALPILNSDLERHRDEHYDDHDDIRKLINQMVGFQKSLTR